MTPGHVDNKPIYNKTINLYKAAFTEAILTFLAGTELVTFNSRSTALRDSGDVTYDSCKRKECFWLQAAPHVRHLFGNKQFSTKCLCKQFKQRPALIITFFLSLEANSKNPRQFASQ